NTSRINLTIIEYYRFIVYYPDSPPHFLESTARNAVLIVQASQSTYMASAEAGSPRSPIRLGLCAMAKKAKSKPMTAILTRLSRKFGHIRILVFEERDILEQPVEAWPVVDALISFYSHGFPLEKVAQYAELRKPFLVNDLISQRLLMNRQKVYERLREREIPVVRYAVCHRGDAGDDDALLEAEDHIVLNGVTFNKPFVEKPLDADDHNIRIYFPSTAGGGSVRLFRKVGNCSSVYHQQESRVRRLGSFVYEEFMATDGADIKVYAIGGDYAHAEARKSPALDGKVERDPEGKEMRCPVILTAREKIIAKKVVEAFNQTVCGFDLLRANGVSYVCDVNGFSFVKSSEKYYDDCAFILATLLTQAIAPSLSLSVSCPSMDRPPLVRTTFGTVMELRCLIAVIRHSDRTSKQKLKMPVYGKEFYRLFNRHRGDGGRRFEAKLKKPAALQELLNAARSILMQAGHDGDGFKESPKEDRSSIEQVRQVLEMHGRFRGINRKAQLKFAPRGGQGAALAPGAEVGAEDGDLLLVLKWGGALTEEGRAQAEKLGRAFRGIYPGGESCPRSDGLGPLRLHSTYRHDLKIYASDEGRVQTTAAAFAKGFLDLEGPLTPILVQMVQSGNTSGLLDSDNTARKCMSAVKCRIQESMSLDRDFTEADVQQIAPDGSAALIRAMCNLGNPKAACRGMRDGIEALIAQLEQMELQPATQLYHGETVELALGRWQKLLKDFQLDNDQFQLAKVPDIYDNIKYDLLHNTALFNSCGQVARQLCFLAKNMADIVVPSEYGITSREKLFIAQQICNPLLKKILADMEYTSAIDVAESEASGKLENSLRSLNATQSQHRFVRTRLYFTSESHLHSVINVLRHGDLANPVTDEQWSRAIDYCNAVTELNYLTQIVFMIYEDSQYPADSHCRYHVELHFSPGCVAATPEDCSAATAPVVGYRPRRHCKSVCGALVDSGLKQAVLQSQKDQAMLQSQEDQAVLQSQEDQAVLQSQEDQAVLQSQEDQAMLQWEEDQADLESPIQQQVQNSESAENQSLPVCQESHPSLNFPRIRLGRFQLTLANSDTGVATASEAIDDAAATQADPKQHLISTSLIRASDPELLNADNQASAAKLPRSEAADSDSTVMETALKAETQAAKETGSAKESSNKTFCSSSASDQHQQLATAPCVPGIYPLETLHNSLTLRQVELFLHRFT
uniref:Inositol hexakisphosphate and diphosphoinositol-pentakisphosphate kinase n=1 Tax=Macrostomum lignano TaxID=282301 RepID=A0A1I8II57_9PLAT